MILKNAKRVLKEESKALKRLASDIGENFEKAVKMIMAIEGKVVVIGIGKSGLIGRKIAATLSSTGTPSLFLHAVESLHGDIGVISSNDLAIIISYSGATEEISMVLPVVKRFNVPTIALTGHKNSTLAKNCDEVIEVLIEKEACPMNLVPTTSTTAMLAIGDAIAISLLEEKGFKAKDFATRHPRGILGKKLLLTVDEVIFAKGANPMIGVENTVKEALIMMTASRVGATSIVDEKGVLIGYFTDGDLRRHLQKEENILNKKMKEVMTVSPTTIKTGSLAIEARDILKNNNFDNFPVIDEQGHPVGIIDERDIIREGL